MSDQERCPKCGTVMCQQFDDKPGPMNVTLAVPNGTYICYKCGYIKPSREQATGTQDEREREIRGRIKGGYPITAEDAKFVLDAERKRVQELEELAGKLVHGWNRICGAQGSMHKDAAQEVREAFESFTEVMTEAESLLPKEQK